MAGFDRDKEKTNIKQPEQQKDPKPEKGERPQKLPEGFDFEEVKNPEKPGDQEPLPVEDGGVVDDWVKREEMKIKRMDAKTHNRIVQQDAKTRQILTWLFVAIALVFWGVGLWHLISTGDATWLVLPAALTTLLTLIFAYYYKK